jgi:hypothetical protein
MPTSSATCTAVKISSCQLSPGTAAPLRPASGRADPDSMSDPAAHLAALAGERVLQRGEERALELHAGPGATPPVRGRGADLRGAVGFSTCRGRAIATVAFRHTGMLTRRGHTAGWRTAVAAERLLSIIMVSRGAWERQVAVDAIVSVGCWRGAVGGDGSYDDMRIATSLLQRI